MGFDIRIYFCIHLKPVMKKKRFAKLKKYPLKLIVFLLISTVVAVLLVLPNSANSQKRTLRPMSNRPFISVCGLPGGKSAKCHAKVLTENDTVTPFAGSLPASTSMGPAQFHTAYSLPCTPGGVVSSQCAVPSSFGPQTVAIVDAYHYPTVENDLTVYSNQFGIPTCTKANGCLSVVNQNGGTTLPTTVNAGWALETAMDVQVAHAICQTCKIVLIEASSANFSDLGTAVNTAAAMSVTAISNSYGAAEFSGETTYDSYYNHSGIAVTVSSGDNGYGNEYPASSKNVVAVGGTTLQLLSDNTYSSESVWNGSGSGCSAFENALSFQTSLSNWSLTGCSTKRAVADVSADADPNSGAGVYTTTAYNGQTGWFQVGGTSLSSPLIAGVYALAGGVSAGTLASSILYQNYSLSSFHDVTTGSNGSCSTIMCKGVAGFDGPTGLGTPNGITGFGGTVSTATPTLTSTPIPTPTPVLDTTPPTVSITSPLNNSIVQRNSWVTVSASASDNIGVKKVEFYVNNSLLATDSASPYNISWKVPNTKNIAYTLSARAYDAAGNTAVSSVKVTSK